MIQTELFVQIVVTMEGDTPNPYRAYNRRGSLIVGIVYIVAAAISITFSALGLHSNSSVSIGSLYFDSTTLLPFAISSGIWTGYLVSSPVFILTVLG